MPGFKQGNVRTFSYIGWSDKYNEDVDIIKNRDRLAMVHTRSTRKSPRLKETTVGTQLDIFFEGEWYVGTVKKLHKDKRTSESVSSQVQVVFPRIQSLHKLIRWFDLADPYSTKPVTEQRILEFKCWIAEKRAEAKIITSIRIEEEETNLRVTMDRTHSFFPKDMELIKERSGLLQMLMEGDASDSMLVPLKSPLGVTHLVSYLRTGDLMTVTPQIMPYAYHNADFLQCAGILTFIDLNMTSLGSKAKTDLFKRTIKVPCLKLAHKIIGSFQCHQIQALVTCLEYTIDPPHPDLRALIIQRFLVSEHLLTPDSFHGPGIERLWDLAIEHNILPLRQRIISVIEGIKLATSGDYAILLGNLLPLLRKASWRPLLNIMIETVYIEFKDIICPRTLTRFLDVLIDLKLPHLLDLMLDNLPSNSLYFTSFPILLLYAQHKPSELLFEKLSTLQLKVKRRRHGCPICTYGKDWLHIPFDVLRRMIKGKFVVSDWGQVVQLWLSNVDDPLDQNRFAKILWKDMVDDREHGFHIAPYPAKCSGNHAVPLFSNPILSENEQSCMWVSIPDESICDHYCLSADLLAL